MSLGLPSLLLSLLAVLHALASFLARDVGYHAQSKTTNVALVKELELLKIAECRRYFHEASQSENRVIDNTTAINDVTDEI